MGIAAGTLSAVFLTSLNWATDFREGHLWLIYFLPLAGLGIGLLYHHKGKHAVRGNNLIFDTIHNPKDVIPFRMVPLVLISTVVTHLFGGSAGREGTALQMSGAAADQLYRPFRLSEKERKVLLIAALSAGFAAVFGTPLAGALFGIEVLLIRKFPFKAVIPALVASYLAVYVTSVWGVEHTQYHMGLVPAVGLKGIALSVFAGCSFGIAAVLFVRLTDWVSYLSKYIKYLPFRTFAGGLIVVMLILFLGTFKYIGLGIPVISDAFQHPSGPQDFLLKILLTAITLGMGFKGGEVTPLFFIGATCGSAMSMVLPLPVGLLAGMGFVAVFGAAAKTPLACIVMAAELFGLPPTLYIAIACIAAYFISGKYSIYNAPENKMPGHFLFRIKHFY